MTSPGASFLIVGSSISESVSSKLTASGTEYVRKSLVSSKANWREIQDRIGSDLTAGVIITLNRRIYERIARDKDQPYVVDLLNSLALVPHLVLVHEAVYGGEQTLDLTEPDPDEWEDDSWSDRTAAQVFGVIDDEVRLAVNALLRESEISLSIYRRNAEASLLAVAFIDDQLGDLLFRLYIPGGRLFEQEATQLISMFHDWMTNVRGINIRKDGYQTSNGRVIEFHANGEMGHSTWSSEVAGFQEFVAVVENPEVAQSMLEGMGLAPSRAQDLVAKYAKQARRLQLDIKYEKQRRELAIREQFESELIDEAVTVPAKVIADVIDSLMPSGVTAQGQLAPPQSRGPVLQINQQYIEHAEGIVAQNIAGNALVGLEAQEIEKLISTFGDEQASVLAEALRELVDKGAPTASRLRAKQRIKAFLLDVAGSVKEASLAVLKKWVEAQLGL